MTKVPDEPGRWPTRRGHPLQGASDQRRLETFRDYGADRPQYLFGSDGPGIGQRGQIDVALVLCGICCPLIHGGDPGIRRTREPWVVPRAPLVSWAKPHCSSVPITSAAKPFIQARICGSLSLLPRSGCPDRRHSLTAGHTSGVHPGELHRCAIPVGSVQLRARSVIASASRLIQRGHLGGRAPERWASRAAIRTWSDSSASSMGFCARAMARRR